MKALQQLYAQLAIPMALTQWSPVHLPHKMFPSFNEIPTGWKVTSLKSAGGYVYFFDHPVPVPADDAIRVTWDWSVSQFPAARPKLPFDKKSDDYPVRVGLLFDDEQSHMSVPSEVKSELNRRKQNLSFMVFYGAERSTDSEACGVNPYSDRIWLCLKHAGDRLETVTIDPVKDARAAFKLGPLELSRLQLIGFWVVSDSDDSSSDASAEIKNIKVSLKNST